MRFAEVRCSHMQSHTCKRTPAAVAMSPWACRPHAPTVAIMLLSRRRMKVRAPTLRSRR